MPFDALQNRLGAIPEQQFQAQPAPPVYPIGDIIQKGVDQLNHVIDTFSPLSVAERKAKLSQSIILQRAYELGAKGDLNGMQDIIHHMSDHEKAYRDPYASKDLHDIRQAGLAKTKEAQGNAAAFAQQIAEARAIAAEARKKNVKPAPAASSPTTSTATADTPPYPDTASTPPPPAPVDLTNSGSLVNLNG